MALWITIGVLYYITCFIVCLRLLGGGSLSGPRSLAVGLLVALLLGNAVWNAVFFRHRALRLSWWVALSYWLLAVTLAVALWGVDRVGLWVFMPYLGYLLYGTWWVYQVWRLNGTSRAA